MTPRTYYVHTFGCRLNQFDSAAIAQDLRQLDYQPVSSFRDARVVIVNSCTVTHRADADARRFFFRVKRENPASLLIATGCWATWDKSIGKRFPEIDLVVSNADKQKLAELASELDERGAVDFNYESDILKARKLEYAPLLDFGQKSRAFLKVQDGCNAKCSFCIIPQVRGASRSLASVNVVEQVKNFTQAGYAEIVLTGIHLGSWGRDFNGTHTLLDLLKNLTQLPSLGRLRLSSVEPKEMTPELVRFVAENPKIATHYHVPLQSASDKILVPMKRPYLSRDYRNVMEAIQKYAPDAGFGADVIVGFPSETDEDFETTFRFIENSNLTYLHVFSYSERPGTEASQMSGKVPERIVTQRSRKLRQLSQKLNLAFRKKQAGQIRECVRIEKEGKAVAALTDNFIEVELPSETPVGQKRLFPVQLTKAAASSMQGEIALETQALAS